MDETQAGIASLAAARVDKHGDNRLWTPKEAAEAFVADIVAGKIAPVRVIIIYEQPRPGGGSRISTYKSHINSDEQISLLTQVTHLAIHERLA